MLINAFTIFEDKIKGFHESHFQCMTYFDVKKADLPIGTDRRLVHIKSPKSSRKGIIYFQAIPP